MIDNQFVANDENLASLTAAELELVTGGAEPGFGDSVNQAVGSGLSAGMANKSKT